MGPACHNQLRIVHASSDTSQPSPCATESLRWLSVKTLPSSRAVENIKLNLEPDFLTRLPETYFFPLPQLNDLTLLTLLTNYTGLLGWLSLCHSKWFCASRQLLRSQKATGWWWWVRVTTWRVKPLWIRGNKERNVPQTFSAFLPKQSALYEAKAAAAIQCSLPTLVCHHTHVSVSVWKKERKPPVGRDTLEFSGVFVSDRVSTAGPTRQSRIYRKTSTSSPEAKYPFRFSRPLWGQLVFVVTINPTTIHLGYVFHQRLPWTFIPRNLFT